MRNKGILIKVILLSLLMFILFSAPSVIADTVEYTYDNAGRLIRVDYGENSIQYTYDVMGNLLSRQIGSGISLYIRPGWNTIALAIDPGPLTAEELCIQINNAGGICEEIDRFTGIGWDAHICGLASINDFPILPGNGYFVKSVSTSTWTQSGSEISSPLLIDINIGWNSISIPDWAEGYFSVQDLIDAINNQDGCCEELDRFIDGRWEGHINNFPFNNFPILSGQAYMARCSCASQFKLEKK
jgi:YD repeat-containing protein